MARRNPKLSITLTALVAVDVLLCASCRNTPQPAPAAGIPKYRDALRRPPLLRVEIGSSMDSVRLEVDGPYRVEQAGQRAWIDQRLAATTVKAAANGIALGDHPAKSDRLTIVPTDGDPVRVGKRAYRGRIVIERVGQRLNVVNVLDVDTMLDSVVSGEMPAYWPMDALEAQAVTARSFLLYRRILRHDKPVHVRRQDVRYLGVETEHARSRAAVESTRGVVMVYDWEMFPAYFHSTCGGHTTNVTSAFGEELIPPLAGVACGYCRDATYYEWHCTLDKADAAKRLGLKSGETIRAIRPDGAPAGQQAPRIVVETSRGEQTFSAYRFRMALGPDKVKSSAFSAVDAGQAFELTGHGWGHGVGLCQWGARGMARAGYDWRGILAHYFPEAKLVRVY